MVLVVLDEEDLVVVDDEAAKARAYVSEMLLAWVDLAGWRKCRNMKCLVVGRWKKKMNGQWQETRGHACGPKNCVVGGSSVLEGGGGGGVV